MNVSRTRSSDVDAPRRRRAGTRVAMVAVPAGLALAVGAVIATGSSSGARPATAAAGLAADAAGSAGPIFAYGGLCLDDQGGGTQNYNPIQLYGCNSTGAQQWTVDSSNNTIQLLGKCLDVQGGRTADGTLVDLYDCNGTGAQEWIPQSDGTILNPQSDKCLTDTGSSASGGTQAEISDCGANWSNEFTIA
jgi:Ricin-type beta-trefoil lectin domain